ncbi:MAG: FMN-binding protein [Gammaproteobacteria bacterium]|nr:FMN-binding protein [Gammaproteobacteria bacterium]
MIRLLTSLILLLLSGSLLASDVYQSNKDFLAEVFDGTPPAPGVLWLREDIRTASTAIMGHPYPGLRIRYWSQAGRSAWILEEIGKERPITVGLVVNDKGIERIRVLAFRESRGWEVRHPFFTDQFTGIGLTADRQLDHDIDGISGATLSVRALEKLARLALYLHDRVHNDNDTQPQH